MPATTPLKAYLGISVDITTAAQRLLTLLVAIDDSLLEVRQNCASLKIQSASANGAAIVYVGDSAVSAARCAYELLAHDQVFYEMGVNMNVPLRDIFVIASAAAVLNVELVFA